jgi:hypothetical protein
MRLIDVTNVRWQDRAHFFAICARIMRRILIEAARARMAGKRGGEALSSTTKPSDWAPLDGSGMEQTRVLRTVSRVCLKVAGWNRVNAGPRGAREWRYRKVFQS